ncbi:MAG TPA: hypothetical protein VEA38_23020 [Terriglobales bacterium]|nr:hypothetical protein [Terriglobales bacterium]
MSGLASVTLELAEWIESHLAGDNEDHSEILALCAQAREAATFPRMVAPGVVHLGNTVLPDSPERLKAIIQARAEVTGYEHAIIDVGGDAAAPRFLLCWPTGDETALADLVANAFADVLAAVERNQRTEKGGAP